MAAISLSGLTTGIDTAAIVQQLIQAEQAPLLLMQSRQKTAQTKVDSYNSITNKLKSLQTAVDQVRSADSLRAFAISSSNTEIATVLASSAASEGSHEVVVDRLASAERDVHAGLAAKDTKVGLGAFAYSYDGTTRTLQTTADTTLEGLAALINNDAGNPGITASLLEYDSGDGNAFHLVLGGTQSGGDYAIAIDDSKTSLDGTDGKADFRAASFLETQAAQDSRVRVDNYPAGGWIERSSNTLDDVLPGVTLNLHKAGTIQVSLSRDTTSLKGDLKDLVKTYNEVVSLIDDQSVFDPASKKAGPLNGDFTVSAVKQQLRSSLMQLAAGFADGSDTFVLASQLGLSIDREGKLSLDEVKLDEALNDDYQGVLNLLGASRTGVSDSSHIQFYTNLESTAPGIYDVQATFDGSGTLMSARIKLAGESTWRDATVQANRIMVADGSGAGLELTANWDGVSTTQSAKVRVRQGIGGRMYDAVKALLSKTDGPLKIATDGSQARIDQLQKNIERETDRLERKQAALQLQYARLEQTLTQLAGQRQALGYSQ